MNELEAARYIDRLRGDFEFFCQEMWSELRLDRYHAFGRVERIVARYLANGPRKRGVLAWRGFGKTYLTVMLALWRLFRDQNRRQVYLSESGPEAKKRITLANGWLNSVWFLAHLRPRAGQRDNADGFDVAGAETHKDYSLGCKGIDGQITGVHGDIIADDIESEMNTETAQARQKLAYRTNEFEAIMFESSEAVVIGTYHTEESVYGRLAKDHDYHFITVPMLYPRAGEKVLNLAPELQADLDSGRAKGGDIVAPYRIDPDYVAKKQPGTRWFAMQYMLQTNLVDTIGFPLKLNNLIVFDSARDFGPSRIAWGTKNSDGSTELRDLKLNGFPGDALHRPMFVDDNAATWLPYHRTILCIDPSGGGQSETAWYVGSALNGFIFVHDGGGLLGSAGAENIAFLVRKAREHNASVISVEGNLVGEKDEAQNAWANLLRAEAARQAKPDRGPTDPGWHAAVQVHWAKGRKELRIVNTLEPLFASHRVIVHSRVAGDQALQYQIARVTHQPGSLKPHDRSPGTQLADRIDAFASLASLLIDTTRLDPDRSSAQDALAQQHAEIERMLAEFDHPSPKPPSWCKH